jgi:hypothetical protein
MMIGCLCDDSPRPFNAKDQAKRFFGETGWKPKRLRATRQANDFLSKKSLNLTNLMAKQQKELDEKKRKMEKKERENDGGYDGDGDAESSDDESDDDESLSYKSPAQPKSVVKFDMQDAKDGPIRWTSPNRTRQTAIRIPRTSTRSSFRKSAKQTSWIEQITESMLNQEKVSPDVGVEWLVESIFEIHGPQFESFCERKGYLLPTTARMHKGKTAAMWTDGNVTYSVKRIINQHCYEHFH